MPPVHASPFLSTAAAYGSDGPYWGIAHSLKALVFGSNMPILPARYSANHALPERSIAPRRGPALSVGGVYTVFLPVMASTSTSTPPPSEKTIALPFGNASSP